VENNPTTIELPRLPDESARAYAARVEYVTMGAGRSLEKLRQKYNRNTSYIRQLGGWSSKYGWVQSAEKYDAEVSYITVNEASDRYRADLEAHRKKASDAGQALYSVAGMLLKQIDTALRNPRKIKGEDGKLYTLHGVDMTAGTFAIAARAMQTALDLEAHALGVDRLLPTLDGDTQD
jgi:hypothetical protein